MFYDTFDTPTRVAIVDAIDFVKVWSDYGSTVLRINQWS